MGWYTSFKDQWASRLGENGICLTAWLASVVLCTLCFSLFRYFLILLLLLVHFDSVVLYPLLLRQRLLRLLYSAVSLQCFNDGVGGP